MTLWKTNYSILLLTGWIVITWATTAPAATDESTGKRWPLQRLYHKALQQAEQIGIAEENLAIAENLRVQALSVLVPRLSATGSYTHYTEEKAVMGSLIQPEWKGGYGLRLGQSFTLNGRELSALHVAERGIDKSRADLNNIKESYLYSVAQGFYEVAKSRRAVSIAEANVQRLETHRDAVKARLKLGDIPVTELYRTEAELSEAEAGLIQAKNSLQLNQALLGRRVGSDTPLDIVENPADTPSDAITNLYSLKQTALKNRSDLKSRICQEAMAEHTINYTRGVYWPRVGIEAAWMRILQEPESYMDDSAYVAVNVEMDLFDAGLRRAQVSDARRQKKQAELARRDTERQVTLDIEQVWLFWRTQQEAARAYESQLRYATENYEAVTRLYEHGMANVVEVMDANTLLATAQMQLSDAHYNVQLAVLGVERAAGTLLTRIESELHVNETQKEKP
jgi:outer membrane protein